MNRKFKFVAVILAVLVVIAGLAAVAVNKISASVAHRIVEVSVIAVPYDTNPEALVRGKHLFESRGCSECHGADGNGKVMLNESNGLYIKTPNITTGEHGATAKYGEVDWVRTIRHGVKPSGQPVFLMPSEDFNRLTDADLAALVAYVRSLPAGDGTGAVIKLPLVLKALYAFGKIKDAAAKIDHSLPPSTPIPEGATPEYGAYVANMCRGCHGEGFSGGRIPGSPPHWPPAANLTPGEGSAIARYSNVEAFRNMLRTGVRPDGAAVNTVMPFASLNKLSDVEIEAVFAYLKTLPPKAAGGR